MSWINLDEKLVQQGLTMVPLSALVPNRYKYRVMLHQHKGDVNADNAGVHNGDHTQARKKFAALFQMAYGNQPDILATPEYSCPWPSIEELINGQHWPSPGKVWILGCESITPQELAAVQLRQPRCQWVIGKHQPDPQRNFLDPLCILLTAKDAQGQDVRIAAIQFKCYEMADRRHMIEPNSMLLGDEEFVLRNDGSSIHLAVMLCSDCLAPRVLEDLPSFEHLPYFLIHLQLCNNPCHPDFIAYRNEWGRFDRRNFVIACLNWARGSSVLGQTFRKSGSAWYDREYPITPDTTGVDACHRGGLYYTWSHVMRAHCHLLGYDEHVIILECVKHYQSQDPAVVRMSRRGPVPILHYCWNDGTSQWQASPPDDGFAALCDAVHPEMQPISDPAVSALMRERLACLTAGDVVPSSINDGWHSIGALPTFGINADEVCHRVTFTHDPCLESRRARQARLVALKIVKHDILHGAVALPPQYECLRGHGELMYPVKRDNLDFNVALPNGEYAATFIYLGEVSRRYAEERASELTVPLMDNQQSLVVWFRDERGLQYVVPAGAPTIDRDSTTTAVSVDREVQG